MPLTVKISSITFSDGTAVELAGGDRVVFVGPNNAGKSEALRNIFNACAGNPLGPVVTGFSLVKQANQEHIADFLEETFGPPDKSGSFRTILATGSLEYYKNQFDNDPNTLRGIFQLFVSLLNATDRIGTSNPIQSIDFFNQPKTHPLHHLHQNSELRRKLASWFRRAFGTGIALDFMAGAMIPLHVGDDVDIREGETPLDSSYVGRLRSFPRVETQGDGMRSFVGLLLHIMLTHHRIILVDEPEAFLHPPQARLLGNLLGKEAASDTQLFVATHSADLLTGFLESESSGLRIIRLRRAGAINHASELTARDAAEVWQDPVLRYSNVLSGVFHEKVIVCEADGDCRFYNAVADALRVPETHPYARDVMFTEAGGKGGIPKLVRALRKLDVPVVAVVEFDILRQTGQVRAAIEAFGGNFGAFQDDITRVRNAIGAFGDFSVPAIKREIAELLTQVPDQADSFPRNVATGISKRLKTPPGWQRAVQVGLSILPRGEAHNAGERLLQRLAELGLFIVPCGELESFLPAIELEKNDWVYAALETYRDRFDQAPELDLARRFVSQLLAKPV